MKAFSLVYQKLGMVLSPVVDKAGYFNCIWFKTNARYQQGSITDNFAHICVGRVPKGCIKEIPNGVSYQWLESEGQVDHNNLTYQGGGQKGYHVINPKNSTYMVPRTEEALLGVRDGGTLCMSVDTKKEVKWVKDSSKEGGRFLEERVVPEMICSLTELRERLAPFIKMEG